jgi:hypothetical protein
VNLDREGGPPPAAEALEPEASQSVTVDGVRYDLGSIRGQKAAKRDGVLPERFRQSLVDYAREVELYKAEQRCDLTSGRVRAPTVFSFGFDEGAGAYTHQIQRRGGDLSAPEVIDAEMIEAASRRSWSWDESKRRATAAVANLHSAWRRARLRAVPGGPKKRKRGHRAAVLRDGGEPPRRVAQTGAGRDASRLEATHLATEIEVLVAMMVRLLHLPPDGASQRRSGEVSNSVMLRAPTEPRAAPRRQRASRSYDAEIAVAIIRRATQLNERPRRAVRDQWHREIPGGSTTLIDHILKLMGSKPLSTARRRQWEQEACRMVCDGSVTLDELTQRLR